MRKDREFSKSTDSCLLESAERDVMVVKMMKTQIGNIHYPLVFNIQSQQAIQILRPQLKQLLIEIAPTKVGCIEVVLNEAVNNGLRAGGSVVMTLRRRGDKLIVRVKDQGPGFDGNAKLKRVGGDLYCYFDDNSGDCGRGLGIMKAFCNLILYNHIGNEVLMVMDIN